MHAIRRLNRGPLPHRRRRHQLLWLAIRDNEDERAGARAKEKGLPATQHRAEAKLVEGATVRGWRKQSVRLALAYPDRLAPQGPGKVAGGARRIDERIGLTSGRLLWW